MNTTSRIYANSLPTYFREAAPTHPDILAEFQGGSYNPGGGLQGGCLETTGPNWINVFYRKNTGQKVAGVNFYMPFGGTSWDGLPMPNVGTSYDYSAPILESRMIGNKYSETKLLGYVLRVAHHLTKLETAANGTTNFTGNANVFAQALHNYGPDAVINEKEAKILVAEFRAGNQRLIYSAAEILAVSVQNHNPIVDLWVPTDESGEFQLEGFSSGSVAHCGGYSNIAFHGDDARGITIGYTQQAAYKLWQPMLSSDPLAPLDESILVLGPHLVRNAALADGTVTLTGDYNGATTLGVLAAGATNLVFNGDNVTTTETSYGSIIGKLHSEVEGPNVDIQLTDWKVNDDLPERMLDYDDSGAGWKPTDKNSTSNPRNPDTLPVLYGDEYDFHAQNLLWRGRLRNNGATRGIVLSVIGGSSSGWSVWLNGQYLRSALGSVSLSTTNGTLTFGDVLVIGDNVLLVIQDSMGHDQTTGVLNPRGILNATMLGGGSFTSWRVAGGQANIDPIRGPYNERGLHAEQLGWHLPGFDDTKTTLPLNMPKNHDISLAFNLAAADGVKLRAQLYVNGYMFGKFVPHIGHQVGFPVFPGILNYNGNNTFGLSLWSQSQDGAAVSTSLSVLGSYRSSFDTTFDAAYLQPSWTQERLQSD